jgi:uncharacterized protein YlzI (FlbEa/FlbD family)
MIQFIELTYPTYKTGTVKKFLLNPNLIERLTEYEYEGIVTTKISLTNRNEIEVAESKNEIVRRLGAELL